MIRCYNCGGVGHKTQVCPTFGPYHPGPGKTSQDYGEQTARIAQLFAADIIREHASGEDDDAPLNPPRKAVLDQWAGTEGDVRLNGCPKCLSPAGQSCVSSGGNVTKAHASRWKLLATPTPG